MVDTSPSGEWRRIAKSESLRGSVVLIAMATGVLYGLLTLALFGPVLISGNGRDAVYLHLFLSFLGSWMLSLLVFHNIWVRQLTLPAALIAVVYALSKRGTPQHDFVLCASVGAMVLMFVIGLVEARKTTGRASDLWRSFLLHPQNWPKRPEVKSEDETATRE